MAHIAAHPVGGSPDEMRAAFEALACSDGGTPGTDIAPGGVPSRRFGPDAGRPIVWLHGGGLVFGSSASHAAGAAHLADLTGRPVIVPDYRLAPEHPWPAPRTDALNVLDAVGPADLMGDSAGGLLALSCVLRRRSVGRIALISPNTDRTGQSLTRGPNGATDPMNDDATDARLAGLSFGNPPPADASPLVADLSALPPVWITASTTEVLLDDSLLLIRALGLARVPVTARIEADLPHMWTLWPAALPETARTYAALAAFLTLP